MTSDAWLLAVVCIACSIKRTVPANLYGVPLCIAEKCFFQCVGLRIGESHIRKGKYYGV